MKCLVTGASGLVGSNIVRELVKKGYQPIALLRENSPKENIKDLEVEIRYGDIRDRDSLERAMEGCKVVFHTAALYSFWQRKSEIFYDINVRGTINVLESAKKKGVERVVYTSTTGAIGLSKDERPLDETALENPPPWYFDPWDIKDHYARSKILAQREVLKRAREEKMDIVIVSPSAPIGWGDIKPTPTGLLILKFLNREIPIYSDVGLSLVNVKDVARGHILALEKGKSGEIYILGGHNVFVSEVFSMMSKITGLRTPIKLPRKMSSYLGYIVGFILEMWAYLTGNPPLITRAQARASKLNLFYSSEKAKRELGYEISPLEEAIKDAIRYFVKMGKVKKKSLKKIMERFEIKEYGENQ